MKIKDILEQSNYELNNLKKLPSDFSNRNIVNVNIQNLVLIGPRRLGKTKYLQWISQKYKEDEVLFLNIHSNLLTSIDFKNKSTYFNQFINSLNKILMTGKIKIVLIDEIQEIKEWSKLLKSLIDTFNDIIFIATGSDAESLKRIEAGVGRFRIYFMGFLTYYEFKKTYPNNKLSKYINMHSLPFNPEELTLNDQYQIIYEKQFFNRRYNHSAVKNLLQAISFNPGSKFNRNTFVKLIRGSSDSKINSVQIQEIIDYLINCELIYSLEDEETNIRARKETVYTLYPSNWNLYKFFTNHSWDTLNKSTIPSKGFVFENMVISNVYSFFNTPYLREKIKNKINSPDCDLIIYNQKYEIKSFDVFQVDVERYDEIIEKSLNLNSIILHDGVTKKMKVNQIQELSFINIEEFLLSLPKLVNNDKKN